MPEKTLGQVAYEGYKKKSEGKSLISGAPLPEWYALKKEIQEAWESAIDEVVYFVGLDFSTHYRELPCTPEEKELYERRSSFTIM